MNSILNTSRPGIYVKQSTAKAMVEQCAAAWVIEGTSIRELDRVERLELIRANMERGTLLNRDDRPISKRGDYLPILEPDGHYWEPPRAEKYTTYMRSELVVAARQFCQQTVT